MGVVHVGGGIDRLALEGHTSAPTLDSAHTDVDAAALLRGLVGRAADAHGAVTVNPSRR
jgi:hypothetical protein